MIPISGAAIQARLYAEDPANDFLPATGTLSAFSPSPTPEVRWDSGVERGSVVGTDFDPMLAKVISHAPTRTEAAGRLALALERISAERYAQAGVATALRRSRRIAEVSRTRITRVIRSAAPRWRRCGSGFAGTTA